MRAITKKEYKEIIGLIEEGFVYMQDNKLKSFRPNPRLVLILEVQANLGLRIGDILNLTTTNISNSRLDIIEQKTRKRQLRDININVYNKLIEYAEANKIDSNDKIFKVSSRSIQKNLAIVTNYLQLEEVSTHSFRKLYATEQYSNNNNNIQLVKHLLNHSSSNTTEIYLGLQQEEVNKASSSFII